MPVGFIIRNPFSLSVSWNPTDVIKLLSLFACLAISESDYVNDKMISSQTRLTFQWKWDGQYTQYSIVVDSMKINLLCRECQSNQKVWSTSTKLLSLSMGTEQQTIWYQGEFQNNIWSGADVNGGANCYISQLCKTATWNSTRSNLWSSCYAKYFNSTFGIWGFYISSD